MVMVMVMVMVAGCRGDCGCVKAAGGWLAERQQGRMIGTGVFTFG
jgi:hypothetical protein